MSQHQFYVAGDKDEFEPDKWTSSNQNGLPERHSETHVNVLVVGAGFSGLTTALKCWRKGHNVVEILERGPGPNYSGSFIAYSSPEADANVSVERILTIFTGDLIFQPSAISVCATGPTFAAN